MWRRVRPHGILSASSRFLVRRRIRLIMRTRESRMLRVTNLTLTNLTRSQNFTLRQHLSPIRATLIVCLRKLADRTTTKENSSSPLWSDKRVRSVDSRGKILAVVQDRGFNKQSYRRFLETSFSESLHELFFQDYFWFRKHGIWCRKVPLFQIYLDLFVSILYKKANLCVGNLNKDKGMNLANFNSV